MNTFQSTIASPRNQRILFVLGLLALVAGIVLLVVKLVGGNGSERAAAPQHLVQPRLPAKTQPLTNANGVQVKKYADLDPSIRDTIRRFVLGAVAEQDYADSWKVLAPVFKRGYTAKTWASSGSHPIVPFPVYRYERSDFQVKEATKKEILVGMRVAPEPSSRQHALTFQIGLIPSRRSGGTWLVNYWGPLYGPLVPDGSEN